MRRRPRAPSGRPRAGSEARPEPGAARELLAQRTRGDAAGRPCSPGCAAAGPPPPGRATIWTPYGSSVGAGPHGQSAPATAAPTPNPRVRVSAARRARLPGAAVADSSLTHVVPATMAAATLTPLTEPAGAQRRRARAARAPRTTLANGAQNQGRPPAGGGGRDGPRPQGRSAGSPGTRPRTSKAKKRSTCTAECARPRGRAAAAARSGCRPTPP